MFIFDSPEQKQRIELIITLLAKLYVVLELSPDSCPVCGKTLTHDDECPIFLGWTLLNEKQQHEARSAIRALALSIGCDDSFADPLTH
ncbi:MAG TPA: hypothetical protein VLE19_10450 [Pyrinomonadaceae bacterium]|jgi:hypothetical protein|nr:hypothetical protein [Pyrinomonadaceae bacterium]